MNGREADEADLILGALGDVGQYIFCSSAGVYLKSSQMPHFEEDAGDAKSRHKAWRCCMVHGTMSKLCQLYYIRVAGLERYP